MRALNNLISRVGRGSQSSRGESADLKPPVGLRANQTPFDSEVFSEASRANAPELKPRGDSPEGPGRIGTDHQVALAHDYLLTMRGAERTFASMADIWPSAPIFTSLYDADEMGLRFDGHDVVTSYLQRLGVSQGNFRKLLPLFPRAFSNLEPGDAEVVITSSSAFAHGIHVPDDAMHVCYCHSPFRYVWHERMRALAEVPSALRFAFGFELDRLRRWDLAASENVDVYVANSEITRKRIKEYYGRDSVVVHPPVDVSRFNGVADKPEDFYLFVGEVVGHKRVETAIHACRLAGRKLVVVGSGPDQARLQQAYGDTVTFAGRVPDSELNELLATCRALIAPNVEEFGIAAVEAQAAGRPVIGRAIGGTAETVIEGETGVLVRGERREDFAAAIRKVESLDLDPLSIVEHAQKFSVYEFQRRMSDVVSRAA